jgi:hypothetical protein
VQKFTDVSKVLAASIIRMSVNFYQTTTQKAAIIFAVVGT